MYFLFDFIESQSVKHNPKVVTDIFVTYVLPCQQQIFIFF